MSNDGWKDFERMMNGVSRAASRASRTRQRNKRIREQERVRIMKQNAKINYQNAVANIERETSSENITLQQQLFSICNPQKSYKLDIIEDKKEIENYYELLKKSHKTSTYSNLEPISLDEFFKNNNVPSKNIIKEKFKKDLKEKRIKLEEEYTEKYNNIYLKDLRKENQKRKKEYDESLKKQNDEIDEFNKKIDERKNNFKNCDKKEVEEVLKKIFYNQIVFVLNTNYKENYYVDTKLSYNEKDRTLNLDLVYFSPEVFSKIPKNKKYIKRDNNFKITYISNNEINKYYEGYLLGTSLYIIYEVSVLFKDSIDYIYLNSYIKGVNPYNGVNSNVLVLSSNNVCDELRKINLTTINPKEYFKNVKSRISKKMSDFIPIEPLINNVIKKDVEHYSIDNVNYNLDGFEFEKFSQELLLANGFDQVTVTQASGDYGADVIAYKDDIKYAIQCKKYSSNVGLKAVQEVIASKSIYKCHVAVVLTNNYFTPSAIKLAKENNVLLWDKDKLLVMIDKLKNINNK